MEYDHVSVRALSRLGNDEFVDKRIYRISICGLEEPEIHEFNTLLAFNVPGLVSSHFWQFLMFAEGVTDIKCDVCRFEFDNAMENLAIHFEQSNP